MLESKEVTSECGTCYISQYPLDSAVLTICGRCRDQMAERAERENTRTLCNR